MQDEAQTSSTPSPAGGSEGSDAHAAAPPVTEASPLRSAPAGDADSIADGTVRQLDPRSVDLARRRRAVGAAILALLALPVPLLTALVLGAHAATLLAVFAWLTVVLLLAWQAWSWPALAHRYASYRLTWQGIEIRRGVVFRSAINVPRSRVQHTDVSQGPIERSYGLGRLVVFTAGSSYARVELHGLDHGTALRIRDFLLQDEGSDAV